MKKWTNTNPIRRLLSLALSMAMVLSLLPAGALAEETESTPPTCTCEVLCAETVNESCPVCGTEGGQCAAAQTPEPLLEEQESQQQESQQESQPPLESESQQASQPDPEPCPHGNAPETCEDCASEARVASVQKLIDELPDGDSITADNAEDVMERLDEIDDAWSELTDAEYAALNVGKYDAARIKLVQLSGQAGTEESAILTTSGDISLSAVAGNPEGFNSDEVYAKLFDGDTGTKWCFSFSNSAYVIFKASEPVQLSQYSIATANDTASNLGRNPVAWTLSGCMDYAEEATSWAVIDTHTGGGMSTANETYTDFPLATATPFYQYFKLEITKNDSGGLVQISAIKLTDYAVCEHQFAATGQTIAPTCQEGGYDIQECSLCRCQRNVPNDVPVSGHRYENGICTVCSALEGGYQVKYLDGNGVEQTHTCDGAISVDTISSYGTLSSGWYVVRGKVTANSRITVSGDMKLILADGCNFTVNGGIHVQDSNALTIYAQSHGDTTGSLTAQNVGEYQAGIGGGLKTSSGSITINGGNIEATGGFRNAGIGGGYGSNITSGSITISSGTVTATGGAFGAAGIGGGNGLNISSGSFSTGTDGHAVIFASSIADKSNKSNWSGIIFEGSVGQVYGNQALTEDMTIAEGQTLTIPAGASLTIPEGVTLTSNDKIYVHGTLNGSVSGTVFILLNLTGCTCLGLSSYINVQRGATVTLTPDAAPAGKAFTGWQFSDNTIEVNDNSFTMPDHALTVTALFADIVATVTVDETISNYVFLQDAFAAANDKTATITLMKDVDIGDDTMTISGGEVTFEGGSYTITTGTATGYAIEITGGTLNYQSGEMGIVNGGRGIHLQGGTLNFSGGTVYASGPSLDITGGTSNFFGGHLDNVQNNGGNLYISREPTMRGLTHASGTTKLSGGSFERCDAANPLALLAQGYGYYFDNAGNGKWYDGTSGNNDLDAFRWTDNDAKYVKLIPVSITAKLNDISFTYGDTGKKLSVDASGSFPIYYQWYQNGQIVDDQTDSEIDVSGLNAGSYKYFCRLTCEGYVLDSDTVTVTVAKQTVQVPSIEEERPFTGKSQTSGIEETD